MLLIQKNTFLTSSVNPRIGRTNFFCVCLQTLGQITFAHNFPLRRLSYSSFIPHCHAMFR